MANNKGKATITGLNSQVTPATLSATYPPLKKKPIWGILTPTMFAIIETGGKQYKIAENDVLAIEKLAGDYKLGDKVVFDKVLLMDDGSSTKVGMPYLDGVKIEAEMVMQGRGKKVHIRKFKSKSRYTRRMGHRQEVMKVKVGATK